MIPHRDFPFILRFEYKVEGDNVIAFTTSRKGGVSIPPFNSFNVGNYSDDNPVSIRENRRRLSDALGIDPKSLFVPKQVHGDKIVSIDNAFLSLSGHEQAVRLNECDALITDVKNICIGVTTADCVPVLLHASSKQVAAVVHAGWRGTVKRIAAKTVDIMRRSFGVSPSELSAMIGPSISQTAFEVGEEVAEAFCEAGIAVETILKRNTETGKAHIDLWEANRIQLIEKGLIDSRIEVSSLCTYSNPELFFSARRDGIRSGRMISGIVLL